MNQIFFSVKDRISAISLVTRLMSQIVGIFFVMLVLFFAYSLVTFNTSNRNQEIENAQRVEQIYLAEFQELQDFSLGLAIQSAENPEIQAAFAAGDRQKLIALTLNSFDALKKQFAIRQYQFHLPPAQSFLRLHNLESYGDDLSSFRTTVVQVNQMKQPISGIEVGRGGVGLRGVQPVFYQGRHIGSVEFGLNIDANFVAELKTKYHRDWRMMLTQESMSLATLEDIEKLSSGPIPELLILGTTLEGVYQNEGVYQKVLAGEKITSQIQGSDGRHYLVTTLPLKDYEGKIVGVIEAITENTSVIQTQRSHLTVLVISLVVFMTFGTLFLGYLINQSLKPLKVLTSAAQAIEQGDLTQQVTITNKDEVGQLAATFNKMSSQLQYTFGQLEQRVADRTRALETSLEVSRRLSAATSPRQLAVDVVEQVQAAFGYYHAHIYFFDEQNENLVMAGGTGEAGAAMLASGHSIPRGRGLVGRAAETNGPVLVEDVTQSIGWLPNPLLPDTKSEAAVPISVGSRVLGVLDVQQNIIGGLGENDIILLQSLASQVAISLQNARAYEQSRAQAELESKANLITQKIQRAASIEEVLQTAIREVGQALGASRVRARIGIDSTGPSDEARQN